MKSQLNFFFANFLFFMIGANASIISTPPYTTAILNEGNKEVNMTEKATAKFQFKGEEFGIMKFEYSILKGAPFCTPV